MGSKKRSALSREREAFLAGLGGMDDTFRREGVRQERTERHRENAMRHKACASKQRYTTRVLAQNAIIASEEHGVRGLRCYRCSYCHGWHLTSHPQED